MEILILESGVVVEVSPSTATDMLALGLASDDRDLIAAAKEPTGTLEEE